MDKSLKFLRTPSVWLYVSVLYLWLYALAKLFATIAPTLLIAKIADTDNNVSFIDLKMAFITYMREAAGSLGLDYHLLLYSHVANILLNIPILVIGYYILRKKAWARVPLILFLIFHIITPHLLSTYSTEVSISIINFDTLVYLAIIYMLTRKSIKECFEEAT